MRKTTELRKIRHRRIRARLSGTSDSPRLSVFRSNSNIYAQLIDDINGITLVQANDLTMEKGTKIERSEKVGEEIAKLAKEKWITQCVFDRGGFLYHGRVKALAENARKQGLIF